MFYNIHWLLIVEIILFYNIIFIILFSISDHDNIIFYHIIVIDILLDVQEYRKWSIIIIIIQMSEFIQII